MFGFKLLHRMIFFELAKVFLMAWTALTALLLLAGLVAEATQHGLGPSQILDAIPLLLPNMLPYTLPTTTLFATCIVFGRLAADNEILAIKAAGVHIGHVVWPAVLLGLAATAIVGVMYFDVIPTTHHMLRTQFLSNVEEYLYGILRKEGSFHNPKINYTIDVSRVEGDVLRDAHFKRKDAKGMYDVIIIAKEAKLRVDMEKKVINVHMHDCSMVNIDGTDNGRFEDKIWPVDLPEDLDATEKLRGTDMTWAELFEFRSRWLDDRDKAIAEGAAPEAARNHANLPKHDKKHHVDLGHKVNHLNSLIAGIDAEIQMRPALAMGCLCFVLVGCPVGIWFSKSDYLSAFVTCFLPIIVLYYPLMLSGINLAKSRQLHAAPAIWAANALMLLIAMFLFRRLARN